MIETAYICAKVVAGLWMLNQYLNNRPKPLFTLKRIGPGPKPEPTLRVITYRPYLTEEDAEKCRTYFNEQYRKMGSMSAPLIHTNNRGTF